MLLLERGGERPETSLSQATVDLALLNPDCVETFTTASGVQAAVGRCMGGSTSINQGVWIESTPDWFIDVLGDNVASAQDFQEAAIWVRSKVAPFPRPVGEPGQVLYLEALDQSGLDAGLMDVGLDTGLSEEPVSGMWRTHSIFQANGTRLSADTILDRSNSLLTVETEAEVVQVVPEGDARVPDGARACVELADASLRCAKADTGRVYLSAGALLTPGLLLSSGIGPGGNVTDVPGVGQNLADKPALFSHAYFNRTTIDTAGLTTIVDWAAQFPFTTNVSGVEHTLLNEEVASELPFLLNLALFERNFVPTTFRNSAFAQGFLAVAAQCLGEFEEGIPLAQQSPPCQQLFPLVNANCFGDFSIMASLLSTPTSRGSVTIDPSDGSPVIDLNHLATPEDLEAFGASIRLGFQVMKALEADIFLSPCDPPDDVACVANSCPDLFRLFADTTLGQLADFDPTFTLPPDHPRSFLFPSFLEFLVESGADDTTIGAAMSTAIVTPHHFAGTAAMGSVIDETFAIPGVGGLYVVDASVLPNTSRGNPMATVMTVARIAGQQFVTEMMATAMPTLSPVATPIASPVVAPTPSPVVSPTLTPESSPTSSPVDAPTNGSGAGRYVTALGLVAVALASILL